ncbi:MAG: LarC family nickel insertion protein [Deltaproteobacteria bacterium]|jgi:uncharacterized protein (DUF111 family)|nr:LarC family nickel insertion protein [Deltaproteobacteria bacterium]
MSETSAGHQAKTPNSAPKGSVLTVRAVSGLSGDMLLTGMALMAEVREQELASLIRDLNLPGQAAVLTLEKRSVQGISGWGCLLDLPPEHEHRTLVEITALIQASSLAPRAAALAEAAFLLLAQAEGQVHGKAPEQVAFHEVGALDSILDICLVCALFARLNVERFVCSPLPLADGAIFCAHGWLPSPAPAVLNLLGGVPVRPFAGEGETVTPTAIALLKTLGAEFAPWPAMTIKRRALVYGSRVFANAPNGSIWACGPAGEPGGEGLCPHGDLHGEGAF